jgi:hypothetical protein
MLAFGLEDEGSMLLRNFTKSTRHYDPEDKIDVFVLVLLRLADDNQRLWMVAFGWESLGVVFWWGNLYISCLTEVSSQFLDIYRVSHKYRTIDEHFYMEKYGRIQEEKLQIVFPVSNVGIFLPGTSHCGAALFTSSLHYP